MKTIKFPYKTNKQNQKIIEQLRRQQSIVIRTSYNEYFNGNDDVKLITNKIKNYNLTLPATFILYGIREGKALFESQQKLKQYRKKQLEKRKEQLKNKLKQISAKISTKHRCYKYKSTLKKLVLISGKLKNIDNQRIIFGGSEYFYKRMKNKITLQEYKKNRLCNLYICGQKSLHGNRHCILNLKDRTLILKVNKNIKPILIKIPKSFKNNENELIRLSEECLKNQNKFSVLICNDTISISYEEFVNDIQVEQINNRILSFDDNPNYIGICITDWKDENNIKPMKIIYKQIIDKKKLVGGYYNEQKKFIKYNSINKINYETYIISKHIVKLSKHFKCSQIVKQELTIFSSNKKKGKNFNRLCNNDWNRTILSNNLKKKCKQNNIDLLEVNCVNSSKLGNVLYGLDDGTIPDMIASAIEIARRSFKYYKGKNNKFYFKKGEKLYPEWSVLKNVLNRWKKEALQSSTREQFFKLLVSDNYRVKFREKSDFLIRNSLNNKKSKVILYIFI